MNTTTKPIPPISLELIKKVMAAVPKVNVPRYCVTTPEYARQLFVSMVSVPADDSPRINVIKDELGSIQVIEKPGQRAAAWFISSPMILRAYLQGLVTEEQLEQLQKMQD